MLRDIIYIFYVIFVILFLLEISARYLMNYNAPFSERFRTNIEYVNSSYGRTLSPSQTVFHTNKGKIVKDSIKYYINSFGQRGESYSLEKSDDEIRVIFLGGSHIFDLNYYYYSGGDFTRQIMNKFDQSVRIINAGVPGYSMGNIAKRIKEDIIHYNPDIVINTIGLTSVEKCEKQPEIAHEVHVEIPGIIATTCNDLNKKLVHI